MKDGEARSYLMSLSTGGKPREMDEEDDGEHEMREPEHKASKMAIGLAAQILKAVRDDDPEALAEHLDAFHEWKQSGAVDDDEPEEDGDDE